MSALIAEAGLPVRQPWFTSDELSHGVTRIVEPAVDPFLRANIWHVQGSDHDLLVDTGMGIASLRHAFPELFEREPIVFITHGHYDHTGGAHEFTQRWAHTAEASALEHPEDATLITSELSSSFAVALAVDSPTGVAPDFLVDAIPTATYDVAAFRTVPAPVTYAAHDGDVIDLGDRVFQVMHLPGHTPGSAGLFEAETGILFTGDMVYEGELLDELPESNIEHYVTSMRRLGATPAHIVHAGHEGSFDGTRLVQLVDEYVGRRAN